MKFREQDCQSKANYSCLVPTQITIYVHVSVVFYIFMLLLLPTLQTSPWARCYLLLLLVCLPAAANFYIVVSQDVVTVVAVVLEMHACVGRDQHCTGLFLCFLHLFSNFTQLACSTVPFNFWGKFLLWPTEFAPF